MGFAVIASLAGHGLIIALAYIGLPVLFTPEPVADIPINVEIVTIAAETAAPSEEMLDEEPPDVESPQSKQEPLPLVEKLKTKPKPPIEPTSASANHVSPNKRPETRLKVATIDRQPDRELAPPPQYKPKAEVTDDESLPEPKVKSDSTERLEFDADRIAALLDKEDQKVPQISQNKSPDSVPDETLRTRITNFADKLTFTELDAIRAQIQRCWSVPAGAREGQDLVVTIRIFVNRDGTLKRSPEILGGLGMESPFYRIMAESAVRAVRKCEPLRVPSTNYEDWREIELTFNPKEMLEG